MNDASAELLLKPIQALLGKTMRLEARCDALEIAIAVIAKHGGLSDEKALKQIDALTESIFQKRLERTEKLSPSLAAEIDYRKEVPDIDFLP